MNFTSAGCIFTNETYVLAGYQPRKQKPFVSGLGGKREGEESYLVTALRETIEELFELQTVPLEWINEILNTVDYTTVFTNGDYVLVHYLFSDLDHILQILSTKACYSPLYDQFPTTLSSLLFTRKLLEQPSEVSHLALLPFVSHPPDAPFISNYFLKDIRILRQKNKPDAT